MKQLQRSTWLMGLAIIANTLVYANNSYAANTKKKNNTNSPQITGALEISTFHDFSNKKKYPNLTITKANLGVEQTLPFGKDTIAFVAQGMISLMPVIEKGDTPFFLLKKFQLDHKNFIAGLTSSNFSDESAMANTLDHDPHSTASAKVVKLGWKDQIEEEGFSYGIAAENRLWKDVKKTDDDNAVRFASQDLPTIAGYAKYEQDFGYLRLGGLFRRVNGYTTTTTKRHSKSSWGANLTSTLKLIPEQVSLKLSAVYGVGIGSYLSSSIDTKAEDIAYVKNSETVLLGMLGGYMGVECCWRPDLRSTFAYGILSATNNKERKKYIPKLADQRNAYKQSHYASANLTYHPLENLMMGVEYVFDKLNTLTESGGKSKHRVQLAAGFKF